jgi:type II secretory pathway component PulM
VISLVFSWFIRIFVAMKSKWFLLTLILFALTACTSPSHEAMRQRLKYVSDCNRADTVFTDRWLPTVDSLVSYFDHHGSANDRMMAHYVQGRVYHDMGEAPRALECYQRAAEQADTTRTDCDLYTLYAVYGQMATLFHRQYLPDDEMQALKMAERIAWKDRDTLNALKAFELRIRPYYLNGEKDSMLFVAKKAREKYLTAGYSKEAAQVVYISLNICLDRQNVSEARQWLGIYEQESGNFDEDGNLIKGGMFYYDKGRYLLQIGQIDSAKLYFEKTLAKGLPEAGYKGLLSVYEQKKKPDSIAKYAKLFAAANDSNFMHVNQQQVEQVRASYNYRKHVKESQRLKEANTLRGWLLCLGLLTLLVLLFLLLWVRAKARERKRRLQELHRINEELQAKYALLTEDYEQKLEEMKRQQEQATDSDDSQSLSQKMEALSFAIRKANIKKEEIAMNTAHIQESAVFRRLQDNPTIARSDEGIWPEVEAVINEAYPGFTDRLRLLLPKMSGKEWQVSLLLKAQLTHQLIAEIICETQGGESNIRRRLSKKLFPSETPSSSKFDDFIGSL